MRYNQEEIKKYFNLSPMGSKGFLVAESCPYCNGKDKFGISFEEGNERFRCFAGGCQQSGKLWFLLKDLKLPHLMTSTVVFQTQNHLKKKELKEREITDEDLVIETQQLPIGFQRIYYDEYLEGRGYIKKHYENYFIGKTDIHPKYKNYILFVIKRDNEIKGWVSRYRADKEKIEKINQKRKKFDMPGVLRWKNLEGVEFDKLLFGYDEIIEGRTKTVYLVEGPNSKSNIDRLLQLWDNDEIKCSGTFGKKISKHQIIFLKNKKVENLVILYDEDAVREIKKVSFQLFDEFNSVKIGFIENGDPGDIKTIEELNKILENQEDPFNFKINKIQKHKLK